MPSKIVSKHDQAHEHDRRVRAEARLDLVIQPIEALRSASTRVTIDRASDS